MNNKTDNSILTGLGGWPKIRLTSQDGASAEIYLHGAHVTSWIPVGGSERLFLSRNSEFKEGAAIRGGIPVIFPQFGGLGNLSRHGFVRLLPWELLSISGDAQWANAKFSLIDNDATRVLWPYSFHTELDVSVGGRQLAIKLNVTNTDPRSFQFTSALHTYFRVEDIQAVIIQGLQGIHFQDTVDRPNPADWISKVQTDPELHFSGEVDRIYYDVHRTLVLREWRKVIHVNAEGFPDAVIWNPGAGKSTRLTDMEPAGYRHMVCIEAAVVGTPVKLQPGQTWQGSQVLSI